ncbi:MAG: hypothetical protein LBL72_06145 [Candidatus Accumulibacter sp.]|jgi:hypothetical protein|nr:hypothetical protein [Accumulibacter sp.]
MKLSARRSLIAALCLVSASFLFARQLVAKCSEVPAAEYEKGYSVHIRDNLYFVMNLKEIHDNMKRTENAYASGQLRYHYSVINPRISTPYEGGYIGMRVAQKHDKKNVVGTPGFSELETAGEYSGEIVVPEEVYTITAKAPGQCVYQPVKLWYELVCPGQKPAVVRRGDLIVITSRSGVPMSSRLSTGSTRLYENQVVTDIYFTKFREESFSIKMKPFTLTAADRAKVTTLLRDQTRKYLATLKKYRCDPFNEQPLLF